MFHAQCKVDVKEKMPNLVALSDQKIKILWSKNKNRFGL